MGARAQVGFPMSSSAQVEIAVIVIIYPLGVLGPRDVKAPA